MFNISSLWAIIITLHFSSSDTLRSSKKTKHFFEKKIINYFLLAHFSFLFFEKKVSIFFLDTLMYAFKHNYMFTISSLWAIIIHYPKVCMHSLKALNLKNTKNIFCFFQKSVIKLINYFFEYFFLANKIMISFENSKKKIKITISYFRALGQLS